MIRVFELHLLESGISGPDFDGSAHESRCLNSTYWNLVFRVSEKDDLDYPGEEEV